MANQLSLLLAALIIGAAIVLAQFAKRYEIAAATNTESAAVWRLNAWTGDIELCWFADSKNPFAELEGSKLYKLTCRQSIPSNSAAAPKP